MPKEMKVLQEELTANLVRAERYRRLIRIVKTPIFAFMALWIVAIACMPFALPYLVKTGAVTFDNNAQTLFMRCFMATAGVIMVLTFCFSRAQKTFALIEYQTVERIVRELFPQAKMHAVPQAVPGNILKNSMLFSRLSDTDEVPAQVFASLELPSGGRMLHVADLGITHTRAGLSALLGIYAEFFRQIFKSRYEMASYLFRGMFAWAELEKRIPGSIVIVPDHLEDKLGYMARHLQTLKNRGDMRLTTLEDAEFERLFAVYTTDEVLARYVLTPAMMRDITELRLKYGRDMMLSFNANRFSIAVAMPDGFLNLRGKAIRSGNIVEEIYADMRTTQAILTQIKLDKAV